MTLSAGDGVLGLSWVPEVGKSYGGICHRRGYVPSLSAGNYSLNTVIVTQLLRSYRVSDAVASTTVIHEVGHSFGAHHDDVFKLTSECMPGPLSPHGDYVMASVAPMGIVHQSHNFMFSRCSRESMHTVLASPLSWCFKARVSMPCGNGVVDPGEQCDCGTTYTCESIDKCCTPRSLHPSAQNQTWCILRFKAACSPRVSRCCTDGCAVAKAGITCREATDCAEASTCNGKTASCPAPRFAANGTRCAGGLGRCDGAGLCSRSACERAGLVDCICQRPLNHACSVCCRCEGASNKACVPAQWFLIAPPSHSLLLPPGAPCLYGGRCDNDGRCTGVSRKQVVGEHQSPSLPSREPTNSTL